MALSLPHGRVGRLLAAVPRTAFAGFVWRCSLEGPPTSSGGARRGSTDCEVSRRPLSSGYRTDDTKKPLRPQGTRGSGARTGPRAGRRARRQGRARRQVSPLTSLVVDLALSDVGRAARGVADAAGVPASQIPATLAFALSRRGLFYPLASLDISGQWPVFEQEPHRNGRSVTSSSCQCRAASRPSAPIVFLRVDRGKRPLMAPRSGIPRTAPPLRVSRKCRRDPVRAESTTHYCAPASRRGGTPP